MNSPQPRRAAPKRRLDGVLFLDKPEGVSSNHALQKARRLLAAAKGGHTGTLDPMATGLLPLAFGEATKFSQTLLNADKTYLATVCLGMATDTGDTEGNVIATHPEKAQAVDRAMLDAALRGFIGPLRQRPPMYSALKKDGKPLYVYAREGIEIERAERDITVYSLEVVFFSPPHVGLRMKVSKGTYVRTLAMDLGDALGCAAHLTALRRETVGPFTLAGAIDLATLEAASLAQRDACLHPVDTLVQAYPVMTLSEEESTGLLQGRSVAIRDTHALGPLGLYRVFGPQGFLGLGERTADGLLRPKRLCSTP